MNPSRFRCLVLTSGLSPCGVATYQHRLSEALSTWADLTTVRLSPERTLGVDVAGLAARRHTMRELARQAMDYDATLIDFTDTFFNGSRPGEALFPYLLRQLPEPKIVLLHEFPGRIDWPELSGGLFQKLRLRLQHAWWARRDAWGASWPSWVQSGYFSQATHTVTHAEALAEGLLEHLPPDRVHLLPTPAYPLPAAPTETHDPDATTDGSATAMAIAKTTTLDPFGLGDRPVGLLLGFPQPSKRFDRAIEVLPYLPREFVLVQVGDAARCAAEVARLMELAQRLGVADRFLRTGTVDDATLGWWLRRATVGLAPFRQVHQSSSVGHMLGAGLPVVAARIRALESVRRDGAGMIFAADHPRAWAAAIQHLLQENDARHWLVLKNYEYSQQNSFSQVAKYLVDLIATSRRQRWWQRQ